MSVKNKAKDRDHNGRIHRKYTSRHKWGVHYGKSLGGWVAMNTRLCGGDSSNLTFLDHFSAYNQSRLQRVG